MALGGRYSFNDSNHASKVLQMRKATRYGHWCGVRGVKPMIQKVWNNNGRRTLYIGEVCAQSIFTEGTCSCTHEKDIM
jgi:hypothetical protein